MALHSSFLELLEPLAPGSSKGSSSSAAAGSESNLPKEEEALIARAYAAEIMDQARSDARTLREDAAAQADALREAAWQEGFHEGQTTGRSAMEITLRDEWDAEKKALRAQVQKMIEEIGTARAALWERQEAEMLELALAIARQVTKTEITQNPLVVKSLIQNALRRVTDKDHVRIRVAASDAPAVRAMREELLETADGIRQLEIIDDRRVGEGGCVIETAAGTIDAKIETQFTEIERALGAKTSADIGLEGFENNGD
jgi:flagellar assembly protein FliH